MNSLRFIEDIDLIGYFLSDNSFVSDKSQQLLADGNIALTMQAACTASLRLAALGSHQNMWQMKSPGPSAMMKAKVWTSFPTPMKDRKRTRHSDRTSSVCKKQQNALGYIPTET
jgi:hypothetical protein